MLITTYNCNSVRSRLTIILDWLQAHRPDVLALQETKVVDDQFPAEAFREAGYHIAFRGQKAYNGVAIASLVEPEQVTYGFADGEDDSFDRSDTRLIRADIGGLTILSVYVPQGKELTSERFTFKLCWIRRLRAWLEKTFDLAKDRVVLVGDLNMAPEPRDVYDSKRIWPHVCHCQEITDAFGDLMTVGLVDIFRQHRHENDAFTYWDYRNLKALERNMGWRIDHVLGSAPAAKLSSDITIDVEARRGKKPSDHTFVTARFEI